MIVGDAIDVALLLARMECTNGVQHCNLWRDADAQMDAAAQIVVAQIIAAAATAVTMLCRCLHWVHHLAVSMPDKC
jgi:hypothetical protein